jgi:hypothetical protein
VPEGLTRDGVLDNITHFWLRNAAVSAGRLYAENMFSFFGVKGVGIVPVPESVFSDELYQAPLSCAEQAYPTLIHYKLDKDGHFAAREQSQLFCAEVPAAVDEHQPLPRSSAPPSCGATWSW